MHRLHRETFHSGSHPEFSPAPEIHPGTDKNKNARYRKISEAEETVA
jgi:hypothetical protein